MKKVVGEQMTPKQIRKIIEDYPNYLNKKDKLQSRLISINGRDFEQEIVIAQRLETIEQAIEIIDQTVYGEGTLTTRESCVLDLRLEGRSYKEIGEVFMVSKERVRQILKTVYIKIADMAKRKQLSR